MSTRQEFHIGLARSKATSKRDCGLSLQPISAFYFPSKTYKSTYFPCSF